MDTTEIQRALADIGWPIAVDGIVGPNTRGAVADFQRGWTLGEDLVVDSIAGPRTQEALAASLEQGGACGRHFAYAEFASKGNGWIKVARELVAALDVYRDRWGPTAVASGYRDPIHNAAVGGAAQSQHLYGNAADLTARVPLDDVEALGLFSGIGYQGDTGRLLVRHVDVRHVGPNTTGGAPKAPTVWAY